MLKFYNVNVTIEEIVNKLPKGDKPKSYGDNVYATNPEKAFVGNPKDRKSFGVYNKPIADTANKFKQGAVAKNGLSLEEIKEIVKGNNPVIAWVSLYEDYSEAEVAGYWYDKDTKEKVFWINGEHAVVVYGYDEEGIYISNPYNGKKYKISNELFEYNYSKHGKRVVYYE